MTFVSPNVAGVKKDHNQHVFETFTERSFSPPGLSRLMPHSKAVRAGWLTAACYGGMFVFGIVMAVIGALLPRLSIGMAQSGNLFLGLTSTMLVSMLCRGRRWTASARKRRWPWVRCWSPWRWP